MALFDGLNIFGIGVQVMGPHNAPRRQQVNEAPGVDGAESIDLGESPMTTTVRGMLPAVNDVAFAAAKNIIRNYRDGNSYVFTDNEFLQWNNVKLHNYSFNSRKRRDPDLGLVVDYEITLVHLTPT